MKAQSRKAEGWRAEARVCVREKRSRGRGRERKRAKLQTSAIRSDQSRTTAQRSQRSTAADRTLERRRRLSPIAAQTSLPWTADGRWRDNSPLISFCSSSSSSPLAFAFDGLSPAAARQCCAVHINSSAVSGARPIRFVPTNKRPLASVSLC